MLLQQRLDAVGRLGALANPVVGALEVDQKLTVAFPLCFTMMAIEFSRFVWGREIMHSGKAGIHE